MKDVPRAPRVNVCVVGCGHWGKNLARNFARLGHLAALCEADADRLAAFASQYPDAQPYSSFEEAVNDPGMDAFVLATPAEQHHWMALAALRAGKDVFVEKPIALHCHHAQEMIDTAETHRCVLMIGH